jgi:hypothetical protein
VQSIVVLTSAVVVFVAAVARPGDHGGRENPSHASRAPSVPSPLPSGAPIANASGRADGESGCSFADRGFGPYAGWRALPLGKLLIPSAGVTREDGTFDLLLHFHGAEPVRKTLAPEGLGIVVYALDAGVGSSQYEKPFASDEAFPSLVRGIEHEVALATGREGARAGHIALSSWSAGSGAVSRIVARHRDRVAALVLLDSLYGGYNSGQRTLSHGQLAPFTDLARAAMAGGGPFFLSYSAVPTEGYASSSEVAAFLLSDLGRTTTPVSPPSNEPLGLRAAFEEGHLVVRGYGGATKDAHCEHLRYLPRALRDVVLPSFAK